MLVVKPRSFAGSNYLLHLWTEAEFVCKNRLSNVKKRSTGKSPPTPWRFGCAASTVTNFWVISDFEASSTDAPHIDCLPLLILFTLTCCVQSRTTNIACPNTKSLRTCLDPCFVRARGFKITSGRKISSLATKHSKAEFHADRCTDDSPAGKDLRRRYSGWMAFPCGSGKALFLACWVLMAPVKRR